MYTFDALEEEMIRAATPAEALLKLKNAAF